MGCSAPVQCLVDSSVSRSARDQMLKYGLWVINGTAGGRSCAYAEQDTKSVTAVIVIDIGNGLIREVRITLFSCRESSLISLVVTRFRDFVSTWTAQAVIG